MLRRLLINEQPSFASIGYSHQQLSRVPRGTANRHSQFHCPKSKISKVWFALEEDKQCGLGSYLNLVIYLLLLNKFSYLEIKCVVERTAEVLSSFLVRHNRTPSYSTRARLWTMPVMRRKSPEDGGHHPSSFRGRR